MSDELRAGLVAALDRLRTRLAVGEHGDPHVAFAVLVYPDSEPTILAVTERGPVDFRTLVDGEDEKASKDDSKRWFSMADFSEAGDALADAELALRMYSVWKTGFDRSTVETPGGKIAEEVRRRWEDRRERPIVAALARAEEERRKPSVCEGCKRRFTERGLALHLARSRYCPAATRAEEIR